MRAARHRICFRRGVQPRARESRSSSRVIPRGGRSSTSTSRESRSRACSSRWSCSGATRSATGSSSGAVTTVLFVGAAITAVAGFLRRVSTGYTITNRRLHIKHGIVSREVQEHGSPGPGRQLLAVGDPAAAADRRHRLRHRLQRPDDFVFAGVANPSEVVEKVHRVTLRATTRASATPSAARRRLRSGSPPTAAAHGEPGIAGEGGRGVGERSGRGAFWANLAHSGVLDWIWSPADVQNGLEVVPGRNRDQLPPSLQTGRRPPHPRPERNATARLELRPRRLRRRRLPAARRRGRSAPR